jgi:polysaccharide biosynthesis protein PslH
MKILMISSFLPYPLYSGGHIRLYNLIKELSGKHEITLVCEKRNNQGDKEIEEVSRICKKVITVERKKQWSYSNILKTAFSKNPFLITGHTLPEMKAKIKNELENEKYDLIHVETFYVMQNLPSVSIPVVLVEHNIEYLVYKRYVSKSKWFLKPLLNFDVYKIKKKEEEFWKKADRIVAVSKEERELMKNPNIDLVVNGVNLDRFKINDSRFKKENISTVLFIGDFKWIQNANAVENILKEIWPKIYAKNKNLKLWIVGRKIPDGLKKIEVENVIFDENAPSSTEEIYEKADILLSPIYVGGGTSYKILEAMATGVAVVTTSLGAEGIVNANSKEMLIANSPDGLCDAVLRLVEDNNLRIEQIKKARKLIEEKYDWKEIAKNLEYVYAQALK